MLRQVSLKLEDESVFREIARRNDATITVLDCKDLNRRDTAFLLDVSSPSGKANDVIADLRRKGVINRAYTGEAGERPSRSLSVAVLKRPGSCQAVLDSGAFCLDCPIGGSEGDGRWRLLIRDSEQLRNLLAGLVDLGIRASVVEMSEMERKEPLTQRQSEILAKAISMGYFEFPRKFSLTELSRRLGIRPSTLSQLLRAAESKVMAGYMSETRVSRVPTTPRELCASSGSES